MLYCSIIDSTMVWMFVKVIVPVTSCLILDLCLNLLLCIYVLHKFTSLHDMYCTAYIYFSAYMYIIHLLLCIYVPHKFMPTYNKLHMISYLPLLCIIHVYRIKLLLFICVLHNPIYLSAYIVYRIICFPCI